ncbi:amidase signature domain-containing protein [Podospora appendiculata]|uniref:Amidase signature domain-containing protein n=1 Tax=Podospora appendiculata TaxID=314037 RepID=A0AAE1C8L5_9PEZI|nr:amidase signature domain-containing protein [Podospora appendiculata]
MAASASESFDVLVTGATDLVCLLQTENITSVQIVEQYLRQIEHHESFLNAFISVAPRDKVLRAAAALDEERQGGRLRSPLHGIPIVLKDCFITASELGMDTTAGSWALVGAKASKNSVIAQKLVDAGMIILGKTNMTEFAGMKTTMAMPGWSSRGGQTLSPYVGKIKEGETILGHSAPGGSSTGSAVAVAAGFSPLAMGAETIGSIVTPASRAALYALKPTVGVQDAEGMYTLTDFFDSPGPMAKLPGDLLALAEILLGRSFRSEGLGSWEGLSVGFLDPAVWRMADEMCKQYEGTAEQMREDYEEAISRVRGRGCQVKYPVDIASVSALTAQGEQAIMPIAFWDFKNICTPRFLNAFDESPVRSLQDIVDFNEKNSDKCLPPPYTKQDDLVKALHNDDTPEHIASLKEGLRAVGKQIIDRVLAREGVNIIAAPADSSLCIHAAAAGYPIAVVPLGQLRYNGRPFGLCLIARENDEESLLRFMVTYEKVSAPRAVPDLSSARLTKP